MSLKKLKGSSNLKTNTRAILTGVGGVYKKTGSTFSKNARKKTADMLRDHRKRLGRKAVAKRFIGIAERKLSS